MSHTPPWSTRRYLGTPSATWLLTVASSRMHVPKTALVTLERFSWVGCAPTSATEHSVQPDLEFGQSANKPQPFWIVAVKMLFYLGIATEAQCRNTLTYLRVDEPSPRPSETQCHAQFILMFRNFWLDPKRKRTIITISDLATKESAEHNSCWHCMGALATTSVHIITILIVDSSSSSGGGIGQSAFG